MISKWNKVECIDMIEDKEKDNFVTCMTNDFRGWQYIEPALAPLMRKTKKPGSTCNIPSENHMYACTSMFIITKRCMIRRYT